MNNIPIILTGFLAICWVCARRLARIADQISQLSAKVDNMANDQTALDAALTAEIGQETQFLGTVTKLLADYQALIAQAPAPTPDFTDEVNKLNAQTQAVTNAIAAVVAADPSANQNPPAST